MDPNAVEPAVDPVASTSAESPASTWKHVYSRHLMNMALLIMIPVLVASTLNRSRTLLVDPDIWWHLSDARVLMVDHHFIHTDPYSFSVVGRPWIDWEWLSEIPFWFAYKAMNLQGIYLVTWLLLAGNILFVYWRGYWMSRRADAALWTSAIAFILMTVNSGPRTIEFAYLCMSAEFAILEAADRGDKRFLWLLPPLFCLWINLHGFWSAGIVLFGLYILCNLFSFSAGVFEQKALAAPDRNRLLTVFGVSIVALLFNPYGWHLLWNPLDMALNQKVSVAQIAEWQPMKLSTLEGKTVIVAIALMIIANCVKGRKWKIYEMVFIFIAWYAAFSHVRFSYFAAVITIPMLARDLARAFNMEKDTNTIPAANVVMAVAAFGVIAFMFPRESALDKMLGMMFPQKMIASLQPEWRTMNWDYVGGMMAWQQRSSFIDSRFDSFEHAGVMQDYGLIVQGHNAFELMDKYHIDHALLKDDLAITYLLEHTPGWQIVQRQKAWEGEYLLFARTGSGQTPASACAAPLQH